MKTSGISWFLWLAAASVFAVGGLAGKSHLDASAHPALSVAIYTAAACLLALICFVKGVMRLIKEMAKE